VLNVLDAGCKLVELTNISVWLMTLLDCASISYHNTL